MTTRSGEDSTGATDATDATGNFAFLRREWPDLHDEALRAERLVHADPRTSCFYARRTLEFALQWMYASDAALGSLRTGALGTMIDGAGRAGLIGPDLRTKMNLIRTQGNYAVHRQGSFARSAAVRTAGALFHVLYWLARTYARHPEDLPAPGARFDPHRAPRPAPAEVRQRERAELRQQEEADRARRTQLARENAELRARGKVRDARIAELQARVAEAKAANRAHPDTHDYDEEETRDLFVDVLLKEAGWDLTEDRDREFPLGNLTGTPSGRGRADYVLWDTDDKPLAVIEAKRTRTDPYEGREQARRYADALAESHGQRPVIFYTNGYETHIWDDGLGYPPRQVRGFRTRDELRWLIQQRAARRALLPRHIDPAIADRFYQQRAVQRVGEAWDRERRRRALLVMATGTGKTRTAVALVDLLQKAHWARRVLFLADRQALVTQAVNAFKNHLPDTPAVNLLTEKGTEARVFVSTYPTMMNLIEETTEDGRRRFGPGFFDLVIIDEAHRSVYDKYGQLFSYFDSLLLGLTATPKDGVDRSTYQLFGLQDGVPTDSYGLDEAVTDGFLVPPKAVDVPLKVMRRGLRYDDLSDAEKEAWENIEWAEDGQVPAEITPEEVNRFLFNGPTVDQALEILVEFGHRVEGNDRLGKTIVFAKNSDHARFIEERYNANHPRGAGHDARVVTYQESRAQQLIDDFSDPARAPDIAISVDMLDTGIDVPEVLNLVFFKPVYSPTKFWQMIGRGTRLRADLFGPGRDKENFSVFDLCGNIEFFNAELGRDAGRRAPTLSERLLQRRLDLVRALDRRQAPDPAQDPGDGAYDSEPALRWTTVRHLRDTVAGMNLDNFLVRPHRRDVEFYSDLAHWHRIDDAAAEEIKEGLLRLPSEYWPQDEEAGEEAKRFDLTVYSLQLAALEGGGPYRRLRDRARELALELLGKRNIPAVRDQAPLLEAVAGEEWWRDVTVPMLEDLRRRLRGLVRLVDDRAKRKIVYSDFEDELGDLSEVDLKGVPQGTDEERFRKRTRAYLVRHADLAPVRKLAGNVQVTEEDLKALESAFLAGGIASEDDLERVRTRDGGLGLFVRQVGGLGREAARDAFSAFLAEHALTARQRHFTHMIVEHVVHNGTIHMRDLYEQPFRDRGTVDELFGDEEIEELEAAFKELRSRAVPTALAG